jgi:hypothetical protein
MDEAAPAKSRPAFQINRRLLQLAGKAFEFAAIEFQVSLGSLRPEPDCECAHTDDIVRDILSHGGSTQRYDARSNISLVTTRQP